VGPLNTIQTCFHFAELPFLIKCRWTELAEVMFDKGFIMTLHFLTRLINITRLKISIYRVVNFLKSKEGCFTLWINNALFKGSQASPCVLLQWHEDQDENVVMVERYWQGARTELTWRRTCSSAALSTIRSAHTGLELNVGLQVGMPAIHTTVKALCICTTNVYKTSPACPSHKSNI
jgi:hypothetical protein